MFRSHRTCQRVANIDRIKDAFTQHWIEELLDRARDLKKRYPQRTSADIQMELMNWVTRTRIMSIIHFWLGRYLNLVITFLWTELKSISWQALMRSRYSSGILTRFFSSGQISLAWNHTSGPKIKEVYAKRLQATNTMGLSIHAIRSSYIMQYANSLIAANWRRCPVTFHVYDLVDSLHFCDESFGWIFQPCSGLQRSK